MTQNSTKILKAISPDYATCEKCRKRFKINKKHSQVCPKCYKIVFEIMTKASAAMKEACKYPIGRFDNEPSSISATWNPKTNELIIGKPNDTRS